MTFPHNCFSIWSPGLLLLSLFLYFFSHLSPADLWTDSLCRIITKHDWLLSRVLNVALVDLLYVRKIERRLQVNGQQNKQKKKLVKAHSSMDLREGVCVCVRVEEFDLNRKSRCEKWWMLTRTNRLCVMDGVKRSARCHHVIRRVCGTSLFVLWLRFTQNRNWCTSTSQTHLTFIDSSFTQSFAYEGNWYFLTSVGSSKWLTYLFAE